MSAHGTVAIVLHAHLPFIRHPEQKLFYEESWLYEAMAETYIPLLGMMERLWNDSIDFRLTMGVTPPLCEMLADPLLTERFDERLEHLIHIATVQHDRCRNTELHDATGFYVGHLNGIRDTLDRWGGSILTGLRTMQYRGKLELMTCGATHGYLPLMATDEGRRAQVEVAAANHERHFGRRPRGIWLPECAFAPGLDEVLADAGIKYYFMEKHGLLNGTPAPRYGTARPIITPAGVVGFGRDPECSNQVWSADTGYPGHADYREFYRDLGYEGDWDLVKPLMSSENRTPIGLKYHRITGTGDHKAPWKPEWASDRAADHAGNFLFNREQQLSHLAGLMDTEPFVVAPFDAELFGHWWFEGPWFLENFFRKAACDQDKVKVGTPGEFVESDPSLEVIAPSMSSWGDKGYFHVWLNKNNSWCYRQLHRAEERMVELCEKFGDPSDTQRRALNQAGRELLLAQASDWAFLLSTETAGDYPTARTVNHLKRFMELYHQLLNNNFDIPWIAECEKRDNIFKELDYRAWAPGAVRRRGSGTAVTTCL